MFSMNLPENKINLLRNDFETDYRILTEEIAVERLNVDDLVEIIQYGWDRNDLQRMLDTKNYQAIECLAAWIRECGECTNPFLFRVVEPVRTYIPFFPESSILYLTASQMPGTSCHSSISCGSSSLKMSVGSVIASLRF